MNEENVKVIVGMLTDLQRKNGICSACGLLPAMDDREECICCILRIRGEAEDEEAKGVGDS